MFDVISFNTILQSKSNKMSRFPHDAKVYVGDLGSNASKQEIEDAFGYYGALRSVWVARNPPGFAFVEFEDARWVEVMRNCCWVLKLTSPIIVLAMRKILFVGSMEEPYVEEEQE